MNDRKPNYAEAHVAFVDALSRYQMATLQLSQSLLRMTGHTHSFCQSIHHIVSKSASLVATRH